MIVGPNASLLQVSRRLFWEREGFFGGQPKKEKEKNSVVYLILVPRPPRDRVLNPMGPYSVQTGHSAHTTSPQNAFTQSMRASRIPRCTTFPRGLTRPPHNGIVRVLLPVSVLQPRSGKIDKAPLPATPISHRPSPRLSVILLRRQLLRILLKKI